MNFFLDHPILVTWLFLKMNAIGTVFLALFIAGLIITVVIWLVRLFLNDEYHQRYYPSKYEWANTEGHKLAKRWTQLVLFLLLPLFVIWPTQKDAAIILGVSAGVDVFKKVADSPITNKAIQVLESYVDATLDEMVADIAKKKEKK